MRKRCWPADAGEFAHNRQMRKCLPTLFLLAALAAAPSALAACVPVTVEAPLPLSKNATSAAAGCLHYQRAAATLQGDAAQVLVFGDPQVKSPEDVGYFRKLLIQPLQGKHNAALGISLGDLVDDAPQLYVDVKAAMAALDVPWMHAPGNHDVDLDAQRDATSLTAFHKAIGPDTFARETALANIAVLDDVIVQPGQKPAYVGGLRDEQFAFLERWLPTLPKQKLLVLAMHIPLFKRESSDSFRDEDRKRLYALLKPFPHVLVLSAHTHVQQQFFHSAAMGWEGAQPLHEYNVGAACGAFWSGVKDAQGIPAATMADGTPNGYAVMTVKAGGGYALAWHNPRDTEDTQIGLHAPNVLRKGAYPAWGVFANYYMGDERSTLEFRVDDGAWKPMRKVLQADPRLVAENMHDDEAQALRSYDRSPEAKPSTHLWRGALPTDLSVGEHTIEVRTTDRWRGEVRASTHYRLEAFREQSP